MKDLKVRYWEARKYWVIDARRVGYSHAYGNFATEQEAIDEAAALKSMFILGALSQKIQIKNVHEAADIFMRYQYDRVKNNNVSLSFQKDLVKSLKVVLSIKVDAKPFRLHNLNIMTQQNKDELSDVLLRGIQDEGKSKATADKRIKFLKMFLNYCVRKGWASINVMDKVSLNMSADVVDRAPRIQPSTIQRIVSKGLPLENQLDSCMVLISLATGMRQGELRALSWSSIDFDNQIIKVQAAVKHGTSNIGAPKTKRGRRSIPVDAKTIKALKVLKLQSKYSKDNDLVFPSSNGTPKLQKVLDKLLTRVCKRAGVDKILWGDMRHFYASVQLSSLGEDWSTVAALMGHSTPNFTYKQYGHYVSNDEKQDKTRTAAASAIYGGY
tara:strand:+ start:965 stop:2113 length:1149 start_codon:yes stop_codon:yes gene_type:complete